MYLTLRNAFGVKMGFFTISLHVPVNSNARKVNTKTSLTGVRGGGGVKFGQVNVIEKHELN